MCSPRATCTPPAPLRVTYMSTESRVSSQHLTQVASADTETEHKYKTLEHDSHWMNCFEPDIPETNRSILHRQLGYIARALARKRSLSGALRRECWVGSESGFNTLS